MSAGSSSAFETSEIRPFSLPSPPSFLTTAAAQDLNRYPGASSWGPPISTMPPPFCPTYIPGPPPTEGPSAWDEVLRRQSLIVSIGGAPSLGGNTGFSAMEKSRWETPRSSAFTSASANPEIESIRQSLLSASAALASSAPAPTSAQIPFPVGIPVPQPDPSFIMTPAYRRSLTLPVWPSLTGAASSVAMTTAPSGFLVPQHPSDSDPGFLASSFDAGSMSADVAGFWRSNSFSFGGGISGGAGNGMMGAYPMAGNGHTSLSRSDELSDASDADCDLHNDSGPLWRPY